MPYSTFEALGALDVNILTTSEAERLYWLVQTPISDAVFFLDDGNDPSGPRQPAFGRNLDGIPIRNHPLLDSSFFEPPVSSVTLGILKLEYWADSWARYHWYEDDEDDPDGTCRCCGRLPPPSGRQLTVEAGSEGGFITIGDYVEAVHPWLVSLRQDLLWACSADTFSQ